VWVGVGGWVSNASLSLPKHIATMYAHRLCTIGSMTRLQLQWTHVTRNSHSRPANVCFRILYHKRRRYDSIANCNCFRSISFEAVNEATITITYSPYPLSCIYLYTVHCQHIDASTSIAPGASLSKVKLEHAKLLSKVYGRGKPK
jgi:hypothetical protein